MPSVGTAIGNSPRSGPPPQDAVGRQPRSQDEGRTRPEAGHAVRGKAESNESIRGPLPREYSLQSCSRNAYLHILWRLPTCRAATSPGPWSPPCAGRPASFRRSCSPGRASPARPRCYSCRNALLPERPPRPGPRRCRSSGRRDLRDGGARGARQGPPRSRPGAGPVLLADLCRHRGGFRRGHGTRPDPHRGQALRRNADLRALDLSGASMEGASLHDAKVAGVLFPTALSAEEISLSLTSGTRMRAL